MHLRLLPLLVLTTLPGFAQTTGAFFFDGNLNNSGGGTFAMSLLGGSTSYTTATVFGQSKSVLSLSAGQGLGLTTSGLTSNTTYTVVMDVRTSEVIEYNKLLALDAGNVSDNGVYANNLNAVLLPSGGTGGATLSANTWFRVALTYDGITARLYSGTPGSLLEAATQGTNSYFQIANTVQLFKDDSATGGTEQFPVTVSAVWISNAALTQGQISALTAVPEPSTYAVIGGAAALGVAFLRRRAKRRGGRTC